MNEIMTQAASTRAASTRIDGLDIAALPAQAGKSLAIPQPSPTGTGSKRTGTSKMSGYPYHPKAFAIGWRDVIAAWAVCTTIAAVCFGV